METVAAGYGAVFLAVVFYVAWLARRQSRLAQQYESLRVQLQRRAEAFEGHSRAA